jgi:DNA-binding NarL/FixJ family response regulator
MPSAIINDKMIKVIIVEDHELFRLGLRTAIELRHPDIAIVGEAGSGGDFFYQLSTVETDIVLLDIALPDMNGIDIARRLKNEHPLIKILVVSAENTTQTIEEMINIGIDGFISKLKSNPDTLVEAIRTIMQGVDYFGKDIAEIISRIYIAKKKSTQITPEFSDQERHIIECCQEGLSGKLIADRLCLSLRTVDWHKSNIFRKLGINSTLEMVRFAVTNGIV